MLRRDKSQDGGSRSKSRFSVLGALSSGPKSGYDIKKATEASTGHFWAESYGNLYPLLKRLEREGLVSRRTVTQAGRPDRRVYRLTEAGTREFREWLTEAVEPAVVRNELLLKLFYGGQVPTEVSQEHVKRFRARQLSLLDTYRRVAAWLEREHAGDRELPFWLITLGYGRRHAEAMLSWCDDTLAVLESIDATGRATDGARPTPDRTPREGAE